MQRRHMLAMSTGAALAYARPGAFAQAPVKRIGHLDFGPRESRQAPMKALWQRAVDLLQERGWVEGRNLQIEFCNALADAQGPDGAARQLVASKVDVIVTYYDYLAAVAKRATSTVPIVAISFAPVEIGLAQSLRRPGGNVTGASFQAAEENGRVISLLRDMRPGLARVGVPANLGDPGWRLWFESFVKPAESVGIRMVALPPPYTPAGIAPMLDAAAREQVQALIIPILHFLDKAIWQQITAWAIEHKVVTRGPLVWKEEVVVTFGANVDEILRLWVEQIDRVLRGANPAETPFLQATTWETIVNQRLARAVGWPAPRSVLLQATQVIE